MRKLLKNLSYFSAVFAILGLLTAPVAFAQPSGAPKCEKCFRGPDGKIKCESVPCPK